MMLPYLQHLLLFMQHTASSLLFPDCRRRVLELLLLHPGEVLHGREIARRTQLPSGTITRELARLAEAGLLTRAAVGNQVMYSANRSSPIHEELASILRKTSALGDVLAQALSVARGSIIAAFVSGSIERGPGAAARPVDVVVIGSARFGDIVKLLLPAQEAIGREIRTRVFRPEEWLTRIAGRDSFVADVLARPKIFLLGSAEEVGAP